MGVANLPVRGLLDRVTAINSAARAPDEIEARALLPGAGEPPLTVAGALNLLWASEADRTVGMSDDQRRIRPNPRRKAVRSFVTILPTNPA